MPLLERQSLRPDASTVARSRTRKIRSAQAKRLGGLALGLAAVGPDPGRMACERWDRYRLVRDPAPDSRTKEVRLVAGVHAWVRIETPEPIRVARIRLIGTCEQFGGYFERLLSYAASVGAATGRRSVTGPRAAGTSGRAPAG